ncbi:MAG: TIGR01777 family oxidoreductase [Bifidobacteriaceae bacterium]|jgi:uncharacterized protein (TIGR01777 family)|nr:TIGR01777 family oxidoreductase [Bifidobacteriaceae bacterium]
MRVLLAGQSGMIGQALGRALTLSGQNVRPLLRAAPDQPAKDPAEQTEQDTIYYWTGLPGSVPPAAIAWADAVVSLNGAALAQLPWTKRRRQVIMASRVDTASAIARSIRESASPPAVWVSASACGYYGSGLPPDSPPLREDAPSGTGFLAGVVRAWEAAAWPAASSCRLVLARTGLVLGPAGLMRPLALATRFGLGVRFGDGRQYWPWISLRDEVRAIAFTLEASDLLGPVNLAGPELASAGHLGHLLARISHRPYWLRLPAGLLRASLGPAAQELMLASQPVEPAGLLRAGFTFLDQTPAEAIVTALGP